MKKALFWVTGAVCLGHMLFAMANNGQGVLLTSFIDAFSLSSGAQGLPNAAANVGVLAAMLLAVPMAARTGKPALFAGGLTLMAVTLALAGAAASAAGLMLAYLAMGFGFGCVDTCASAIVADLHQGRRASLWMGVLHAVYGTGGILAPILMTAALSAGAGWRAVLFTLSGVVGGAVVLSALIFSKARTALPAASAPPQKLSRKELLSFFGQRGNLALVLSTAFYCAHQVSIYLWISRIIGVGYGNVPLGAAALSLFWVGTVLSRLLTPLTGLKTLPYLRFGMVLTSAVLLLGVLIGGAGVVCAAAALVGLIGGAFIPMALSEITRRNPAQSMLGITAVLLTTALSAILCAPLIGFIVDKTSLLSGLAVSDAFAAVCALCAFWVGEEREARYL